MSKSLQKLQGIVDACGPRLIVVSNDVNQLRQASKLNFLSPARRMWPDLPYKVVGSAAADSGRAALPWLGIRRKGSDVECFDEASLVESDVAFLQFTSGSTSEPKGVMVTFGNLMHNANYISRKALRVSVRPTPFLLNYWLMDCLICLFFWGNMNLSGSYRTLSLVF